MVGDSEVRINHFFPLYPTLPHKTYPQSPLGKEPAARPAIGHGTRDGTCTPFGLGHRLAPRYLDAMKPGVNLSKPQVRGSIEVITGSMFSGKTEELIRRLRRAELAGLRVLIFKPEFDKRYGADAVVSHNRNSIPCYNIHHSSQITEFINQQNHNTSQDGIESLVIGIDEAQFLDQDLIKVALLLSRQNHRVLIAGLDMDFLGQPFGPMPALMAVAEEVTKVRAICSDCGHEASHSHRHTSLQSTRVLGAQEHYRPLCRPCFNRALNQANSEPGFF